MSINLRDGLFNQPVDHVLEDLLVRFVINVPDEDLSSIERVFFQVEEAQWFYTDFARALNPELPSMKMKSFAPKILSKCPLLWKWGDPSDALPRFGKYKSTIPVRGVAMLNEDLTKVLLLKGIESNTWSFPRGKISKDEADLECAIREAREETGFDAREYVNEKDVLERTIFGKNFKIYLAKGVPEDFHFEPLVRNEIAEIRWFDIKNLQKTVKHSPNKYFVVNTLLKPLTKWVNINKGVVSDEELMRRAEIKLKALMGISNNTQANADAGRELLDILQGAKPQVPVPNVPTTGFPGPHPQQQFVQVSLPQHLQNVYSGFAQMPHFFAPPVPGQNHFSMAPAPEFHAPYFNNTEQRVAQSPQVPHYSANQSQPPLPSSLPKQTQNSKNSKELLSILKGPAIPKGPAKPSSPPVSRGEPGTAGDLLSILRNGKPNASPSGSTTPVIDTAHEQNTPAKKVTLLKRNKTASEENASATLMNILKKKSPESVASSPQISDSGTNNSEGNPDKTQGNSSIFSEILNRDQPKENSSPRVTENKAASAEILGILNQFSAKPDKKTHSKHQSIPSSSSSSSSSASASASAELLNVLHPNKSQPSGSAKYDAFQQIEPSKKPIRLAKRGDGVPADLQGLFANEAESNIPVPSTPADLSAGNQILQLIKKDSEVKNTEPVSSSEASENFEDFEDFEDFDDISPSTNHLTSSLHESLNMQSDDETFNDAPSYTDQTEYESFNYPASAEPSSRSQISTFQNTYGIPQTGESKNSISRQRDHNPLSNGGDILRLLKRNPN